MDDRKEAMIIESHPFSLVRERVMVLMDEEDVETLRQLRPELNIRKPSSPQEVEELSGKEPDDNLIDVITKAISEANDVNRFQQTVSKGN